MFILIMVVLAGILKFLIKSTFKFILILIIIGILAYFGIFILPALVGNLLTIGTYC